MNTGTILLQKVRESLGRRLRWYTSIDFLPVRNFYMALETGDLRWILKLPDYEEMPEVKIDLSGVWNQIWDEYASHVKSNEYSIHMMKIKEIRELESRYEVFKGMIFVLNYRVKVEYIRELESAGFRISTENNERYQEDLNRASHRIRNMRTEIEVLLKEFTDKKKVKSTGWEDLIDMVERHRGQSVDIDKLSMKRFISMLNKLNDGTKGQNKAK